MLQPLTLKTLPELGDGIVATAWELAVKRAAADCMDRPGDERPRKVILECVLLPVVGESAECESTSVQFQVKDTVPTRRSKVYDFQVRRGGLLLFNDLSPDNAHQRTIDQTEGDEE